MKQTAYAFLFIFCLLGAARGQNTGAGEELAYHRVVTDRAHKIATTLGLTDSSRFNAVRAVIAQQYKDLRQIHEARDRKLETVKRKGDKKTADKAVKKIEAGAKAQQDQLHGQYLSRLSGLLDSARVARVKDGMTYNALPITYQNYLAMLPTLTPEQKARIWSWLAEARELAMDGGSSEEKLATFGKYKGKITNYLTAAGYDLKKEEKAWLNRVREDGAAKRAAARSKEQTAALEERARSIVSGLGITEEEKKAALQAIMVEHFDSLQVIISHRKKAMDEAAAGAAGNKELADARSRMAWDAAGGRLNKVHAAFLGKLSRVLTPEQNERVKDLMTEGGLQREYDHYSALFPGLTPLQKAQVLTYLREARENAMDAETAKDRTNWFIKYRGRANNFLSAAGYDLRKATEEWEARKGK
jgi:Spy/CpxP family protein refolding chaperone